MTRTPRRKRDDNMTYTSDRFLSQVSKEPSGCWLWTGPGQTAAGYAHIYDPTRSRTKDGNIGVHVWAHLEWVGPIPDLHQVDHLCHVPGECTPPCLHRLCVNPDHLKAVTVRENGLRSGSVSAVNASKTHCDSGHEFSPENTGVNKDGSRWCRSCARRNHKSAPTVRDILVCVDSDCDKPQWKHGLCQRHCWVLEEEASARGVRINVIQTCGAPGCTTVGTQSLGYCSVHYNRIHRKGSLTTERPWRGHVGCTVDGCESDHYGLGLCERHYKAQKKHGDPLAGARVSHPDKCLYGDGARAKARGFCARHYNLARVAVARGDLTWGDVNDQAAEEAGAR
jgi:hypothetical protein